MDYNDKPELDELVHFGVKGMHWGHRKAPETSGGGGGGGPAPMTRKQNRQLNKEFKAKENAKRDSEIDAARDRYNTNARANYLAAKAQYKVDKKTIGTAAAKAKFNEVKNQNLEDHAIAQQAKSGRETTVAVLATVGAVALYALGTAAQARR